MALTAPSTAVAAFDKGRLAAGISASDTTITVGPIYKTVNGVRTKQGFDSTSGEFIISQGDYQERGSFEGSSVNSTTKVTSLTTCTRGLPVTNITANFTGGTGRAWPKGAYITVIDSASYNQSSVFKNVANSFTAVQTFGTGGAVRFSGTDTSGLRVKTLTTAERDALTPANGDLIYNSSTGVLNQYIAGAWSEVGDTGTSNASTTVAGKVEEATAAELGVGTAEGGTGARLFINPSLAVKTSSGAVDENKIPVLNADGALAIGHIATGTPDGTKFVRDDGVLATPPDTSTDYSKFVLLGKEDSTGISGNTTSEQNFDTHTYSVPSGGFVSGVGYEFEFIGSVTYTSGTLAIAVKLGSTQIITFSLTPAASGDFYGRGYLFGTAAAGASVAVTGVGFMGLGVGSNFRTSIITGGTGNVATNGGLTLQLSGQFGTANGGTGATLKALIVNKVSTSAF